MNAVGETSKEIQEKLLVPWSGLFMLLVAIALPFAGTASIIYGASRPMPYPAFARVSLISAGVLFILVGTFLFPGLKVLNPNEALVLTLFGTYYGTIKEAGFFFVNPFCTGVKPKSDKSDAVAINVNPGESFGKAKSSTDFSKKISLKTMTLNNQKQKVNDILGNPIIIGAVVIWRVVNPTQAVFTVEDYQSFLSIQCDSTIRNVARRYPYDTFGEEDHLEDETTLRGSSQEIADSMKKELQDRVKHAGLWVEEVRITHLSYAEEIAAAMLQRQQAVAVIAARKKIVEGAVGMVQMAIETLGQDETVVLDEERKAAMISNLLVVLCGNKDVQPVVNSSSIY